jgi:arsenate reductase
MKEAEAGFRTHGPRVAFICTHNSCRSQMAEALGKLLAGDVFESYSAGTQAGGRINPDAVRVMKRLYGIDMELTQRPKSLEQLPPVDIVITMGCGVQCPFLACTMREDWALADPTGKDDAEFEKTAGIIETRIRELIGKVQDITPAYGSDL